MSAPDCTFSQQPESNNPGSNAVDGNSSTVWASQGTAYAVIDLGSEIDITCVGVQFMKYGDSRTIPYSVAVSDDNSSYTTIYSGNSVASSGDMIYVSINQNARYVKFTFEGNTVSGWSSVAELAVYTGDISSASVAVEGTINISGGTIDVTTTGNSTNNSSKGIKSLTELNITGGDITVDSYDDAIHSNYNITITGGSMTLASDDDGIHADYVLTLGTSGGSDDDFEINITESYEGIEGSVINVLSGTTYIVSSDDGVNAAGDYAEDGTTSTMSLMAVGGNPGGQSWNTGGQGWNQQDQGMDDTSSYGMLYIKGGLLYVVASGDGLDSNGDIEMSGGTVVVNGPTSTDNGVFDYGDSNSNYFKITGGTLVGIDRGGMSVNVSVSGQGSYSASNRSGSAGTAVKITTDSGNLVFIPEVSWSYIFVTSPDMTSGKSYSVSNLSSYSGGTTLVGRTVNNKFYGLIENAN
ncbi:MAG: carbohydrate-binding domain-containing protein [Clostridia bacterium]|nr:carbohydrate-binding domain-containing protein [Clostridia bacterium]